jgi:CRISPR/Cas system-associated protein Csm6
LVENYVPGDVFILLVEDGFKITTQADRNIYDTEKWPRYFTEITMISLKKKKLQNSARIAKVVATMLRRICETKIEDILGDQFGFRRGKGTMDENRMLKIISEGAFEPEV